MIIHANDHIQLKYFVDLETNYKHHCDVAYIEERHIKDLYIRKSQIDVTPTSTQNPFNQTAGAVNKTIYKTEYSIRLEHFLLVFSDRSVALKYFDALVNFDDKKDIKEMYPELFI